MENFDSLFSNQQQRNEQPFDKEQWAQQKQEKRQELYDMIDEMADRALSEPEMLAAYIKTQARLGMTSVANTLLITAQKPGASYVMSYDDWTQKGAFSQARRKWFIHSGSQRRVHPRGRLPCNIV